MSTHFTATVEVHKVVITEPSATYRGETKPGSREVTEVTKVVVRATTLEKLQARLAAHVNLIEED